MYRYHLIRSAYAALGCAALVAAMACTKQGDNTIPPDPDANVVLIVVDTLRADHLGAYGYHRDVSPHIDRLSLNSTVYHRAYSSAPWTSPSVGTMLTGLYPEELGILKPRDPLQERFSTIAEILKKRGFQTGAVISHLLLSKELNFDQGFDYFWYRACGHKAVCSGDVTEAALKFLNSRRRDKPFFLLVHYFDAHYDYIEHSNHRFSTSSYTGLVRSGMGYGGLYRKIPQLVQRDIDRLLALYDSEIAHIDSNVGVLLDYLRAHDLFNPSIVVLAADHGEEFLEHGSLGHTKTLYNELLHVPLLIKRKGQSKGIVEKATVGLIDLFPTLFDELGIELGYPVSGTSLTSDSAGRPVFASTYVTDYGTRVLLQKQQAPKVELRAIIEDGYKLIVDGAAGRSSLYNVADDRGEVRDIYGAEKARAAEMSNALTSWMERISPTAPGRPGKISQEEADALKALGYVAD